MRPSGRLIVDEVESSSRKRQGGDDEVSDSGVAGPLEGTVGQLRKLRMGVSKEAIRDMVELDFVVIPNFLWCMGEIKLDAIRLLSKTSKKAPAC